MNKVISITIVGIHFQIEEDAYEALHNYIQTLNRHFSGEPGQQEIVDDIESRIAEMFSEILEKEKTEVITNEHIQKVIGQMGLPEDFEDESYHSESGQQSGNQFSGRRFYRDPDEVVLGGVCSGLSAYFGLNDPIWLRVAFILLLFGTGGTWILVYVILWLIIPQAQTAAQKLAMKGQAVNVSSIEKKRVKVRSLIPPKAIPLQ